MHLQEVRNKFLLLDIIPFCKTPRCKYIIRKIIILLSGKKPKFIKKFLSKIRDLKL